jgi:hypothetical protein
MCIVSWGREEGGETDRHIVGDRWWIDISVEVKGNGKERAKQKR